jgi:hypothetical protein
VVVRAAPSAESGTNWPQTFTPERAEAAVTQARGAYRWQSLSAEAFLDRLIGMVPPRDVAVIGIDGRSRSGKTSLAAELGALGDNVAVIHTDEVAWRHSFSTDARSRNRSARAVAAAPADLVHPAAVDRLRQGGSIDIPQGTQVVLVEGRQPEPS